MGNLDDPSLSEDDYNECKVAVLRGVNFFQSINFQVHLEMSSLTPKQEINSMDLL